MLGNLVLHYVWHHSGKGIEATHSVVVTFLINSVVVDDNGDELGHDPVLLELLGEFSTLGYTHVSDGGSSVCEVTHEDRLEMFDIGVFTESSCKFGNEFKDKHSCSPLSILGHVSESGQKCGGEKILSNNICNFL